jgi:hypothetical protein
LPRFSEDGVFLFDSAEESVLQRFRYGEVMITEDRLSVFGRWWPRWASRWDVKSDERFRPGEPGAVYFYYSFPRSSPGFLAINYLQSGKQAKYQTLRFAVRLADHIAEIGKANAIVCQAYSEKLTKRLFQRWGYEQHALSLGENHFIRRLEKTALKST